MFIRSNFIKANLYDQDEDFLNILFMSSAKNNYLVYNEIIEEVFLKFLFYHGYAIIDTASAFITLVINDCTCCVFMSVIKHKLGHLFYSYMHHNW